MAAWLLLVHHLPPTPTSLRVRTWRRLKKLGAILLKQSVFALADSPTARTAFTNLKEDIEAAGGEAAIFAADAIDGSRARLGRRAAKKRTATSGDRGRLWVTRPRPDADRIASAWFIRRFLDPDARFAFADERSPLPSGAVPFDMFGVDYGHHGEHCTFETFCDRFGIRDEAVVRLAGIVHDLDLKDNWFQAPEMPTVGMLVDGLRLTHADDQALLTHGIALCEALYRQFMQM